MQTVILGGGEGKRLRPLTKRIPKPMVPVNGKPFLQYQMEYMRSFGFNDLLLLVGYRAENIREYFGDGSKFSLSLHYSHEEALLGTAGALKNAEKKLEDEFLLLNGDTYLPIDYLSLTDFFHHNGAAATIAVYDNPDLIFRNNISLGASDFVNGYNKRDASGMGYVDAGAIVFKKEILNLIPEDRKCSLEEEIFPLLIEQEKMKAFVTNLRFYDMGTPDGIKAVEEILG